MAYEPDPRQQLFLSYYLDPKSETFSNAYQTALKVGYSEEYATQITSLEPDWFKEGIGKYRRLLIKAEKNIEEFLGLPKQDLEGSTDKVVADISKFVAGRLGKNDWSERKELTGKDGGAIKTEEVVSPEKAELIKQALEYAFNTDRPEKITGNDIDGQGSEVKVSGE